MKRSVFLIVLGCVWGASLAMGQSPTSPVEVVGPRVSPAQSSMRRSSGRREQPQRQLQQLQTELKALESDHQALLQGLKAIEVLAQKEKATQTLESVRSLLDKVEAEHQKKAGRIQNRIRRIERIVTNLEQRQLDINRVGIVAPGFALKDLKGHEVRFSQFKGKTVVLEWISPQSAPVLYHYEKKTLAALRDKVKAEDVVWLGLISSDSDSDAALNRFVDRYGIDWPILDDRQGGRVARAYGVTRTPHVVIINSEGQIAYTGAIDNDSKLGKLKGKRRVNYVDQALNELLAEKPVSIPRSEVYGSPIQ